MYAFLTLQEHWLKNCHMLKQKFDDKIYKYARNSQYASSIFHIIAKSNTYLFIPLRRDIASNVNEKLPLRINILI